MKLALVQVLGRAGRQLDVVEPRHLDGRNPRSREQHVAPLEHRPWAGHDQPQGADADDRRPRAHASGEARAALEDRTGRYLREGAAHVEAREVERHAVRADLSVRSDERERSERAVHTLRVDPAPGAPQEPLRYASAPAHGDFPSERGSQAGDGPATRAETRAGSSTTREQEREHPDERHERDRDPTPRRPEDRSPPGG